ncbi:MAG: hypothetical protein KJ955_08350 [Nanoarchaeota archaeon]|nr:hypothetical protein [Nanoarchaeota archaeon]
METKELLMALKGIQTIKSVMILLGVDRKKAVYYIHRLRKAGYVKTKGASNKTRVYYISAENRLKAESFYDIINRHSPAKIAPLEETKVYGKRLAEEEALIFALKSGSIRVIIASLALFRHITNWKLVNKLAEKRLKRQVCALYDVAKTIMRVRRMPERFKNSALPKKGEKYADIIQNFSSDDFKNIEEKWKVHIPLNKADLEDYA